MNSAQPPPLSIWFIHDQRAGHRTQLEGLAERLAAHKAIEAQWFEPDTLPLNWRHGLFKQAPKLALRAPQIVIGAGHATHLPLLIVARAYAAVSVVLMKPSLPLRWFDAVICPIHDGVTEDEHILNTFGVLNKMTPSEQAKHSHLMLIGGPSKHFDWEDEHIVQQIIEICQTEPQVDWILSDSPRSPELFMRVLSSNVKNQAVTNLTCHHYANLPRNWLSAQLSTSAVTWVTPDSVSMIYEALTAQSKTALFDLQPSRNHKPSRVANSVIQLLEQGYVTSFPAWHQTHTYRTAPQAIWEADRAAQWLLARFSTQPQSRREVYTQ